jgi:hypothetical protein
LTGSLITSLLLLILLVVELHAEVFLNSSLSRSLLLALYLMLLLARFLRSSAIFADARHMHLTHFALLDFFFLFLSLDLFQSLHVLLFESFCFSELNLYQLLHAGSVSDLYKLQELKHFVDVGLDLHNLSDWVCCLVRCFRPFLVIETSNLINLGDDLSVGLLVHQVFVAFRSLHLETVLLCANLIRPHLVLFD